MLRKDEIMGLSPSNFINYELELGRAHSYACLVHRCVLGAVIALPSGNNTLVWGNNTFGIVIAHRCPKPMWVALN